MHRAPYILSLSRFILLFCGILAVTSCDSLEKKSIRQLNKAGIQPSGKALVESVSLNKPQQVRWLLNLKVHTEQRDSRGHTPLRIAVQQNFSEISEMLIEAKADPNAKSPDNIGILGVALQEKQSAIITKLIAAGAQVNTRMPNAEKILPWAIRNGHTEVVKMMFLNGADPHITDEQGIPLLHIAINAGHKELLGELLKQGADPGRIDPKGRGVLGLAVNNRWLDTLAPLATAGADPNLASATGLTLLEQAIANQDTELIPILMKIGADPLRLPNTASGITPLEAAIANGHPPTLRAVLRPGEMLNGPEWEPALWLAYNQDNIPLARMLLSKGARAKKIGANGLTITEAATIDQNVHWLKLLLDYGHSSGKSIYYATSQGDKLTTKFLLDNGADPDFTFIPYIDTPLTISLKNGQPSLSSLLLEYGAKPNISLPGSQRALHLAIFTGQSEIVRQLLALGSDPNAPIIRPVSDSFLEHVESKDMKWYLKRDRNLTPIMLAANTGDLTIARHLLDAGASKNTYTKINRTWPLNFASRRSDVPMMRLLLGQDPHDIKHHIVVSLKEQRARLFDESGKEIFSTKISSGKSGYRTRQGEFVITNKYREHNSSIYGSSMPFFQRLSCSDFGFHYGSLPGYPASHGCIRLPMSSAKSLFSKTKVGDTVTIKP